MTDIDERVRLARLVLGDLAAICLFVLAGEVSHGHGPASWRTLGTAAPFLAGWFLAAPVTGVYGFRALSTRGAAASTVATWLVADVVAQLLRGTELFHGDGSPQFFFTALVFGLLLLLPWRVAAARFGLAG